MSPSEITREQLKRRDFSLVTIFYRFMVPIDHYHPVGVGHVHYKIVVGSPFKPIVRKIVIPYAVMRWGGTPTDIYIYPRNYIDDARALVAAGECVQGPEEN